MRKGETKIKKRRRIVGTLSIIIILIAIFIFFMIQKNKDGDISKVNISYGTSEIYSKEDIDNAIKTTLDYFEKEFKGCTLKELTYAGDDYSQNYKDWAVRNDKEEVIVLISSFTTNYFDEKLSLNPHDEYYDWKWILVRNKGEQWLHVDHGLG